MGFSDNQSEIVVEALVVEHHKASFASAISDSRAGESNMAVSMIHDNKNEVKKSLLKSTSLATVFGLYTLLLAGISTEDLSRTAALTTVCFVYWSVVMLRLGVISEQKYKNNLIGEIVLGLSSKRLKKRAKETGAAASIIYAQSKLKPDKLPPI